MIYRVVEYVIRCDNPECPDCNTYANGWLTRDQAIAEAPAQGWVRCSRNRWLCKRCAEKLLPPTSPVAHSNGKLDKSTRPTQPAQS